MVKQADTEVCFGWIVVLLVNVFGMSIVIVVLNRSPLKHVTLES
jgi:hypothetical protein